MDAEQSPAPGGNNKAIDLHERDCFIGQRLPRSDMAPTSLLVSFLEKLQGSIGEYAGANY